MNWSSQAFVGVKDGFRVVVEREWPQVKFETSPVFLYPEWWHDAAGHLPDVWTWRVERGGVVMRRAQDGADRIPGIHARFKRSKSQAMGQAQAACEELAYEAQRTVA